MDNQIIEKMNGLQLNQIGRAADMCWLDLGKQIEFRNAKGHILQGGMYALHLQCPWRLIQQDNLLVGSYDMYVPKSSIEWSEAFDWDVTGMNLFDEKIDRMELNGNEVHVASVKISSFHDIRIVFSNGCILETFINTSSDTECWRFFKCASDEGHFVVTGAGIELHSPEDK